MEPTPPPTPPPLEKSPSVAARYCTSIKHVSAEMLPDLSNLKDLIMRIWAVRCRDDVETYESQLPWDDMVSAVRLVSGGATGLCLLLTSSGHLGLAPVGASVDDRVFILPEENEFLCILRREPGYRRGVYRFVDYCTLDCQPWNWVSAEEVMIDLV